MTLATVLPLVFSLAVPPTGGDEPGETVAPTGQEEPDNPSDGPDGQQADEAHGNQPVVSSVNVSGRSPEPRRPPEPEVRAPRPSPEVVRAALSEGGPDHETARGLYEERESEMAKLTAGVGTVWVISTLLTGVIGGVRSNRLKAVCIGVESMGADAVDPCFADFDKGRKLTVPVALLGTTAVLTGVGTLISGIVLGVHRNNRFVVGAPSKDVHARARRRRAWARGGSHRQGHT